jgi:regulator of sigma E protease
MSLPAPLVTIVAFAIALGVLVFVHELGHFFVAKRLRVRVLRFSIGYGPIVWSRYRGETEYALSALPLGGYVKMLGEDDEDEAVHDPARSFSTQTPGRRSAIVFAGPAMNFLFAFLVYFVLFATVGTEMPSNEARVGAVTAGSPAERAGLRGGDRVVSVGGESITTWEELSRRVRESGGARLTLVVEREGGQQPVEVTPELLDNRNIFNEDLGKVYRIGIEAAHDWTRVGPVAATGLAVQQTYGATAVVLKGLWLMIRGQVPLKELGGPIAIARAAGQQARAGMKYFLTMLAFLSVNLAVLNLLPIPALDGGHLTLTAVERALGHPLRPEYREMAQRVGIFLLLTLMVFVFYNDIQRLVQG